MSINPNDQLYRSTGGEPVTAQELADFVNSSPPPPGDAPVKSINGKEPDDAGEVTLTASDVGGAPAESPAFTGRLTIAATTAAFKAWFAKYLSGSGHTNAPTTLGVESQYIVVGGHEYGNNSYRTIGFGYDTGDSIAPVSAGFQEKNTGGNTYGDFIVNTRNSTSNDAPVTIFRVTHDGQILAENPSYAPAADNGLANKKYVDDRLSAAQRTAIDALVSPGTDYADLAAATAAIKSIIDALKAS